MKIAFLTEMSFEGYVPVTYSNMRTEFAWMYALNAYHYNITSLEKVNNYDHVFVIFPKGVVYLNAVGSKISDKKNPTSDILRLNVIELLKKNNNKVHYVQEGPHWLWNDYEIEDQVHYYNMLSSCDSIFCHNEHDLAYYKGMFQGKPVNVIRTLLIHEHIKHINLEKENKAIIGGNMARWYGGFESYVIACEFETEIYVQDSHAKRENENLIDNIKHFPRMAWKDWMLNLSTFKYAVHMMPTVAAGTFSLNCAYFGIPCIGNKEVDTQKMCHPSLSICVQDISNAIELARQLKNSAAFYEECSHEAKQNYKLHFSLDSWKAGITEILNKL